MSVISKFFGTIYYDKLIANSGATAMTSAQLDPAVVQHAKVTLSSAQILALHTTPIALVAAPGSGKYISVDEIVATMNFGAAQYTGSNAVEFRYTNGSGAKVTGDAASAWLDLGSTSAVKVIAAAVTPVANAAIVAAVPTADPGAGDGTVTLDVSYRIVTLP
jgi:hypothetical protein